MSGNDFLELIEKADMSTEEWYSSQSDAYRNLDGSRIEWDSLNQNQKDTIEDAYGSYLAEGI